MHTVPFFWKEKPDYEVGTPGDYCETPTIETNDAGEEIGKTWNLGATSGGFLTDVITLCMDNFQTAYPNQVSSLDELPPVEQAGVSLADRLTHSATLFHEVFHMMHGKAKTIDEACEYSEQGSW